MKNGFWKKKSQNDVVPIIAHQLRLMRILTAHSIVYFTLHTIYTTVKRINVPYICEDFSSCCILCIIVCMTVYIVYNHSTKSLFLLHKSKNNILFCVLTIVTLLKNMAFEVCLFTYKYDILYSFRNSYYCSFDLSRMNIFP